MPEHLLVAVWRAANVSPEAVAEGIVDEWAPEALAGENVESCTVSLAEPDQGVYTREPDDQGLVPNCDALIALGLTRAHDLDDVPARDALYALARARGGLARRSAPPAASGSASWPDGEYAPGIKMVSFMHRAEGITHEQFVRHWTEIHTPLALRHHVGLWNYTQNVVRRAYTPGGSAIDGVAELHFRTPRRLRVPLLRLRRRPRRDPSPTSSRFMARPRPETALMRELPLKT